MNDKKFLSKSNVIRIIACVIFIGAAIAITVFTIPLIKNLLSESGREIIRLKVESAGAFGWLMFLGLQFLQVVVALIPGEPIEIIGGILFGTFGGMFLCLLGLFLGTVAVYYLVKAIGAPLVHAFVSEEKINSMRFLKNAKGLETLIFILFLIPGTPKDTLTYFVPLTNIRPWKFFILSTLARIPSVVSSTLVGANIGKGNWALTAVIFAATAAIGLVGIYYNEKLMKKAESKK